MPARNKSVTTIDAYIKIFPKAVQCMLRTMRRTIREAAPQAEECMSYGMPAFKQALSRYTHAKGSVQFPFDQPVPRALVRRIVRFRAKTLLKKKT